MTITPEEAIKWHEQRAAEAHAGLSCGSENSEYRAADKVAEMHRMAARALAENERLREIISRCAASLGNGAAIMPTCTVEFMAELPREIELVTSDLRSALTTEPAAPEGRQEPVACECTKIEQLERENAELKRAIDEARKVIEPFSTFANLAEGFVQARAEQGGSPILPTKHFTVADFRAARMDGEEPMSNLSQIAYNAGLEIRNAISQSGVDPIQHIPEVDAIIERRLIEARREALEEAAKVANRKWQEYQGQFGSQPAATCAYEIEAAIGALLKAHCYLE